MRRGKPTTSERVQKWRSQPENQQRENIANSARVKAWVELARRHRPEYVEIFEQKKAELMRELEEG